MTDDEYYVKKAEIARLRAAADELEDSLKEETRIRRKKLKAHLEKARLLTRTWTVRAAYWACRGFWRDPAGELRYSWGMHYRVLKTGHDFTVWLSETPEQYGAAPVPGCEVYGGEKTAGGAMTCIPEDSYEGCVEHLGVKFLPKCPELHVVPSKIPARFPAGYYGGADLREEPR